MLNWLPLSDRKNIDSVRLIFEPNVGQNYGGLYYSDSRTICVVESGCEKHVASTIAHEYRHHIQNQIRNVPKKVIVPRKSSYESYATDIKWYFSNSISEYDALLYQNKVAKSDLSEYWLKHCLTLK